MPALPQSSPEQGQPLSQDWDLPSSRSAYRPARAIPYELRQHCVIYFEEGLYSQALTLLTNLLASGNSTASSLLTNNLTPAYVPSPVFLALLSTIIVHPSYTTRSTSAEKLVAANHALQFLYDLTSVVGPPNARFYRAFQHLDRRKAYSSRRRSGGSRLREGGFGTIKRESVASNLQQSRSVSPETERDDDNDLLDTALATDASLWACATDFWHIVGWSFNCAVRWSERWARWKLFMQLMLLILESDWAERVARFHESKPTGSDSLSSDPERVLRDSLVMQFLEDCTGSEGGVGRRRAMRAIFATGSEKDMAEFKEIFPRETVSRKKQDEFTFKVDGKLDIDQGEFGDYFEDEEDDTIGMYAEDDINADGTKNHRTSKRSSKAAAQQPTNNVAMQDVGAANSYGGHEAVQIRRRIIVLLSKVSSALPKAFTDISALFDILEEYLRPLPLPIYVALTAPTIFRAAHAGSPAAGGGPESSLSPSSHTSLLQELARGLLPASAPRKRDNYLTQQVLIRFYLPFPAGSSSTVDNTKLSIVLEGMIRLLRTHIGLDGAEGRFREAVEKGISERWAKVRSTKAKGADEAEALGWLEASESRLKLLAQTVDSAA